MNFLVSCGVFHPHKGGAESLFGDLCELLSRQGHGVDVVTRCLPGSPPDETHRGARIRRFDFPVAYEAFRTKSGFSVRSTEILHVLLDVIRERRIRTVCVGLLDMSAAYLLILRKIIPFRLVLYLHGGEMRQLPEQSPAFRRLLGDYFRASDAIVAVSKGLYDLALQFDPDCSAKIHLLRNGFDVALLGSCPPASRERPFLLFVGRLHPEKNVHLIVAAFARIAERIPNVDLVIAGDGYQMERLREQADTLGCGERVIWLGPVSRARVFALMKTAISLVLASDSEGHPIVVLEAFAAGLPVVAPGVPGVVEVVKNRKTGILFEPRNLQAMANAMAELCEDNGAREELRANIRELDMSRYDIRELWQAHLAIWTDGTRGV